MDAQGRASAEVFLEHSQYFLFGKELAIEEWTYENFNGLVAVLDPPGVPAPLAGRLAVIITGTNTGLVTVSLQQLESEPTAVDVESWDDIVDVGLDLPGPAAVEAVSAPPTGDPLVVPTGRWRLRVHARGRDAGAQAQVVAEAPVEEHLLLAWPAEPAPEVVHKMTSAVSAQFA